MLLPNSVGTWVGTNGFRLMPDDPLAEFPARLTVTTGAGGHLTSLSYWWQHPDDGPQEGLLVIGKADEDGSLVAMWGDSWHQKPAPMILSGSDGTGATLGLEAEYGGGWRWRVIVESTDADNLRMQMDNVIPTEHATAEISAGPYPVMIMQTRRA
jgi:Protein of unknown function (DUF1579)